MIKRKPTLKEYIEQYQLLKSGKDSGLVKLLSHATLEQRVQKIEERFEDIKVYLSQNLSHAQYEAVAKEIDEIREIQQMNYNQVSIILTANDPTLRKSCLPKTQSMGKLRATCIRRENSVKNKQNMLESTSEGFGFKPPLDLKIPEFRVQSKVHIMQENVTDRIKEDDMKSSGFSSGASSTLSPCLLSPRSSKQPKSFNYLQSPKLADFQKISYIVPHDSDQF